MAAKRAKARILLNRLRTELDNNEFDELLSSREATAEYDIDPSDFGSFGNMYALSRTCPECGADGRLIGTVDVTHEVETDFEQDDEGDYIAVGVREDYYMIDFIPSDFACNVCKLTLSGHQELDAGDLPASRFNVEEYDLGSEFSASAVAEAMYGGAG